MRFEGPNASTTTIHNTQPSINSVHYYRRASRETRAFTAVSTITSTHDSRPSCRVLTKTHSSTYGMRNKACAHAQRLPGAASPTLHFETMCWKWRLGSCMHLSAELPSLHSQHARLAASFTACANSLVTDIILPLISLLPFLSRNLDEKFATMKHGPNYNTSISTGYNTKDQALSDGAVVFAYGSFIDKIVRFFIIAVSLWVIASVYSRGTDDNIVKKQIKCKFCRKYISEKAKRCVNCTSWQDGREDRG